MKIFGIIWGVFLALVINECSELSPWTAQKIASWSAHLRYAESNRAELRAEELAALIDRRPGKLFKLITALCFAVAAIPTWTRRTTTDVSLASINLAGRGTLRKAKVVSAVLAASGTVAILWVLPQGPYISPTNSMTGPGYTVLPHNATFVATCLFRGRHSCRQPPLTLRVVESRPSSQSLR